MTDLSMNIPESAKPRVVIVGGGFAGINLAKRLDGEKFQVVLLDKYNYHTFQPLLYQVATAGLGSDAIAAPLRDIFEKKKNFHFRMTEVREIIPERNIVVSDIGQIRYDYLVFACGATTNFFGNEELKKKSYPMKQLPEALDLRSKILNNFEAALEAKDPLEVESLLDIVIVGGGPTGVELAGALAEMKKYILPCDYPELNFKQMDIILIEMTNNLLGGMSRESQEHALKFLQEDFGVKVILGRGVKSYDGNTVLLDNGDKLYSKTLIWAAGVMGVPIHGMPPESVARGGRMVVDEFNKVKNTNNIFAIGDISAMISEELPKGHPMLAPVAIQQGELLAENLLNISNGRKLKPFKYNDKGSMATIGRNKAVVDTKLLKTQGFFAWLIWMFIHLVSLIGFRNKVIVFISWVMSYFTKERSARLIVRQVQRPTPKEKVTASEMKNEYTTIRSRNS
jgi:NADH:ubiquinone reductase (H+-translocating)